MMKRIVFSSTLAGALALGAAGVMAQSPGMAGSQARTATLSADQDAERQVTLEGCIAREQDVEGREPGFLERMGLGVDYILTDARPTGTTAAPGTPAAPTTSGQAPTESGAAPMPPSAPRTDADRNAESRGEGVRMQGAQYELQGIAEDELQRYIGQRVEVRGTLEDPADVDTAAGELPELDVESIQPSTTGGSCS